MTCVAMCMHSKAKLLIMAACDQLTLLTLVALKKKGYRFLGFKFMKHHQR